MKRRSPAAEKARKYRERKREQGERERSQVRPLAKACRDLIDEIATRTGDQLRDLLVRDLVLRNEFVAALRLAASRLDYEGRNQQRPDLCALGAALFRACHAIERPWL